METSSPLRPPENATWLTPLILTLGAHSGLLPPGLADSVVCGTMPGLLARAAVETTPLFLLPCVLLNILVPAC